MRARMQGCLRWIREGRSGNEYNTRGCKKCPRMPCCLLILERHLPEFQFPGEWKERAAAQPEIGWNDETEYEDEPGAGAGEAGTSGAHGEAGEGE